MGMNQKKEERPVPQFYGNLTSNIVIRDTLVLFTMPNNTIKNATFDVKL